MTLSDLSIKRPVFAWMLMSGLIIFGAISLGRMGISQMPDIDFPLLAINVSWEGSAPEVLEAELVDPIEQKVIAIDGLKEVRSSVRQGAATIELEFDLDRNIDSALQEVQAAISQVRLPLDVQEPTISKNSPDNEPIMFIGVGGDLPLRELVEYVDVFLLDQFQVLPGVGEVQLGGFSERNLRLWVDAKKLDQYELTILDVQDAVAKEHIELAGGYMENSKTELNVRTMGEGLSPEEVGDILITTRGGQPIYDTAIRIRDVARVEDGLADLRRFSRINDRNAVAIGIRKQRGSNEVAIADAVKKKIEEIRTKLPPGMNIQINVDFSTFVKQSVSQMEHELVIAALLTAVICYLFLGSWSAAFNVILSIPTSIVGTFTVLYFMGFTLNTFTLLALALSIGIVVDDAIMVLENIVRHFQMGKGRVRAAREGAKEITFAAIAATVAVIAIFLPVAFMSGIIGRFFFQFGITLTAAVALSLLEAITLTPMRCSQLMKHQARPGRLTQAIDRGFHHLATTYRSTLDLVLRFRWFTVLGSMALFGLSLLVFQQVRTEFVPAQDQNFLRIRIRTPVGSSLEFTTDKVKIIEKFLRSRPEVKSFFTNIGGGDSNTAVIPVMLTDKKERPLGQVELINDFRKELLSDPQLKGVRITFEDNSTRGLTPRRSQPVEFNLTGPDYKILDEKAKEIEKRLQETGNLIDIDDNYRVGMPEVRVVPDREAAALRGVSMDNIGRTINAAIGGVREGKFSKNGRRYDVRIRLEPGERLVAEDINQLKVRTNYGEMIPLSSVVKLETKPTLQSVSRIDRQRSITISANVAEGKSQAAALREAQSISRDLLPPGYNFSLSGVAQTSQESFNSLLFTFCLGLIIAYMVLASQFNSFIHPCTVLLALPFSLTGALLALWGLGLSLNLYSGIGIILLMGIVKKNSILLVEFANKLREEDGLRVTDALLRAGPIRLRPILMTSFATIGAAIPTALGTGPGSETRVPMAVTIIAGVFVSTLFTLFVIPCAYSLFSRLEHHKTADEIAEDEAEAEADRKGPWTEQEPYSSSPPKSPTPPPRPSKKNS